MSIFNKLFSKKTHSDSVPEQKNLIEMTMVLSKKTNEKIEKLSAENFLTMSELMRKSLALMDLALTQKQMGYHLAVVDENHKIIGEITNL